MTLVGPLHDLYDGDFTGDLDTQGGVTYLNHDSPEYQFHDFWLLGNAHCAILTDTANEDGLITLDTMWGDRTGVLHVARNQKLDVGDFNIYLPVNMMSYK